MTGFRHHSFRWQCGDAANCYVRSLPDWNYLDGVFPRGILPTDIDGMVEVNGHILFIEEKQAGSGPKAGQLSALKTLSRLPNVKVAMIRPGDKTEMQLNVLTDGVGTYWTDITRAEYIEFLKAWSAAAESSPPSGLEVENRRLRRDNEMLRRQIKALREDSAA